MERCWELCGFRSLVGLGFRARRNIGTQTNVGLHKDLRVESVRDLKWLRAHFIAWGSLEAS